VRKLLTVHLQKSGGYLRESSTEPPPAGGGKTALRSQGRMDVMQHGKEYESVLVAIAQAKNWPLFGLLKGLKFEDRILHIENAFLEAAMQRDDAAGLQFFKWLMSSIKDRELSPFLKPVEKRFEQFELPYDAKSETAEENSARPRAAKAQELYVKLPPYETHEVSWLITENEYDHGEEKFPTLLQTHDAMLREISERCFRTHDDAESDTIFSFLLTVKLNNDRERKIYSDALHDATGKSVSLERLERHFEKAMSEALRRRKSSNGMVPDVDREEGVAKTLGKAWVRNLIGESWSINEEHRYQRREGLEHLLSCIKVLEPLMKASNGSIEFLRRFSQMTVAPIDTLTDGLIGIMREERGNSIPPQKVRGDITIGYLENMNHLAVTIDISKCDIFGDAKKQELFVLAKMRTQEWEEYRRFKIHLEVIARNQHAPQEEKDSGKDIIWRYAEDI
jgi:hypothetical protein